MTTRSAHIEPVRRTVAQPHPQSSFVRRMRAADLLVVLCWMSVAAAVSLALSAGVLQGVHDLASGLTAAGIVAGLVGTDLILLMLVLAARIPVIDNTVGLDAAMAVHRALGKPALYLLLGHGVLLTAGYAMAEHINVVAETISMFGMEDLPLAYLGLGLLIAVVVSSLVAVRRRFPYEVWHAIHLLSYVAILVSIPHQLSAGSVLMDGTVQQVYWIGLFVLAFGSIAWFRFILPTVRSVRHGVRVDSVDEIAPGVVSINLSGRDLDKLHTRGGQYAIWRFWSAGTWWHAHPLSFSALPTSTSARITVRNLGTGSAQLGNLRRGTVVSFEGPYGLFTDRARTSPHVAVIAAGIGITPVRSYLEDHPLGNTTVLLRGTSSAETYLWDEVGAIARDSSATVYSMIGHRAAGVDSWMSAEALERGVTLTSVFPQIAESDLYVCGPTAWTNLVVRDARALGLKEHQIHVERFDW